MGVYKKTKQTKTKRSKKVLFCNNGKNISSNDFVKK